MGLSARVRDSKAQVSTRRSESEGGNIERQGRMQRGPSGDTPAQRATMRGAGIRNVELLSNCSEVRDSECMDNDGDECAATFNGKKV